MRFKKILLLNPPNVEQGGYTPSPLGILYLAAYLRKDKKLKIKVIDGAREGEKKLIETLKEFKPDLVGISAMTPGRHEALKTAETAKKLVPKTKIVFGGVHPTIMWQQMLEKYPQIDFIVRGEGELTLWDLVHNEKIKNISGLCWRNNYNEAIKNPERPFIKNLDSLPFPAWDMIDPRQYPAWGRGKSNGIDLEKVTRYSIIFSRGCMACCTFCSSWQIWKGYRFRSGQNVADELELLVKKYGAKHFAFYDDTLTGNKKEIINLCKEIIKRKLKLALHGTTRVDRVDKEMLNWMKKAGFYEIAYGIESGSPSMLVKINKKTDLDRIFEAAKMTKAAGIRFFALMMFGLPRETKEDRALTNKLLDKLRPDGIGTVGEVWIFPGTALYEQAKNAHLINDNFWLDKKPYYIYRGGIANDPINWPLRIKDQLLFSLKDTFLEEPANLFFIKASHLKNKLRSIRKLRNLVL